jgi:DNA-binding NtrC family response regulator
MKNEMDSLIDRMISGGILFEEALQEFEKQFILKMLRRHNNNLSKASVALGIHRNTLSKRLDQYQNGNGAAPKKPARKRKQISPRLKIRT